MSKSPWFILELMSNCKELQKNNYKEMQKGKMVVWEGLTNSCEKKRSEKQRRKGKIFPFECRVPKNSKEW